MSTVHSQTPLALTTCTCTSHVRVPLYNVCVHILPKLCNQLLCKMCSTVHLLIVYMYLIFEGVILVLNYLIQNKKNLLVQHIFTRLYVC